MGLRSRHVKTASRRVPDPRDSCPTPLCFLSKIVLRYFRFGLLERAPRLLLPFFPHKAPSLPLSKVRPRPAFPFLAEGSAPFWSHSLTTPLAFLFGRAPPLPPSYLLPTPPAFFLVRSPASSAFLFF